MTQYQRKLKNVRRVIYISLAFILWMMMFLNLESDLWAGSCLLLSFACTIIFIVSFKVKKIDYKLINTAQEKAIQDNALSLDEIKKLYKYNELDTYKSKILKVYFNKDYTKRCLITQESNAVCVKFENLYFYNDESKLWSMKLANWQQIYEDTRISLYDNTDTAISNNKAELEDFVEDKNFVQQKKQRLPIEISFTTININSNLLPFGIPANFEIKLKNGKKLDATISIFSWYDLKNCSAYIYINEENSLNENRNLKFNIIKNEQIVGIGRYNCK